MTKKIRNILFLSCLFLFIIFAPLIILYSQGYRFDFDPPAGGKRIVQTGGLAVITPLKSVEVYLDGKLAGKSGSLFSDTFFVGELLPKKYKVEMRKQGFHSWEKNLEVREKEVTKIRNVILFPEEITFPALGNNAELIKTTFGENILTPGSPDADKYYIDELGYFYKENDTLYFLKNEADDSEKISDSNNSLEISPDSQKAFLSSGSELWLFSAEKGELKKTFLFRLSEKIENCLWLKNDYLIFNAGGKIKIAEIDPRDKINIIEISDKNPSKMIYLEKTDRLYILQDGAIYQSQPLTE